MGRSLIIVVGDGLIIFQTEPLSLLIGGFELPLASDNSKSNHANKENSKTKELQKSE